MSAPHLSRGSVPLCEPRSSVLGRAVFVKKEFLWQTKKGQRLRRTANTVSPRSAAPFNYLEADVTFLDAYWLPRDGTTAECQQATAHH